MGYFAPEMIEHLRFSDWQVLAASRGRQSWQEFFYPAASQNRRASISRSRHKTLLSHVNDSVYRDILQHMEEIGERRYLVFPDIAQFMKMPKSEGDALAGLVTHVVEWLNPSPTVIINKQRTNKPQLREDFAPAVDEYLSKRYASRDDYSQQMVSDGCGAVEEAVLRVGRRNMSFFTGADGKATLKTHWKDDPSYYHQRFSQYMPWNDLYTAVDKLFHHHSPLPWGRDDTTVDRVHGDERITSTAVAISEMLDNADWIQDNSVLNTAEASYILANAIRNELYAWAINMHNEAGRQYVGGGGDGTATRRQSGLRTPVWDIKSYLESSEREEAMRQDVPPEPTGTRKRRQPAQEESTPPANKRPQRDNTHGDHQNTIADSIESSATATREQENVPPVSGQEQHASSSPPQSAPKPIVPPRQLNCPAGWFTDDDDDDDSDGELTARPCAPAQAAEEATATDGDRTGKQPPDSGRHPTGDGQSGLREDSMSGTPRQVQQPATRASSSPQSMINTREQPGAPTRVTEVAVQNAMRRALPGQRRSETGLGSTQPVLPPRLAGKAGAKTGGRIIRMR